MPWNSTQCGLCNDSCRQHGTYQGCFSLNYCWRIVVGHEGEQNAAFCRSSTQETPGADALKLASLPFLIEAGRMACCVRGDEFLFWKVGDSSYAAVGQDTSQSMTSNSTTATASQQVSHLYGWCTLVLRAGSSLVDETGASCSRHVVQFILERTKRLVILVVGLEYRCGLHCGMHFLLSE